MTAYLTYRCQALKSHAVSRVAHPARRQVCGGASTMWSYSRPGGVAEAALALATGLVMPASGRFPISAFLHLFCCGSDPSLGRSCIELLWHTAAQTGFAVPDGVANFRLGADQCS